MCLTGKAQVLFQGRPLPGAASPAGRALARRVGLLAALTLFVSGSLADAQQAADLPSSPTPNRSSMQNPYYGSVTLEPATDAVLRLSLDDAIHRGFKTNLGLRESQESEQQLHGQKINALQLFLPNVTLTGVSGYHEYNLAALGFGPSFVKKLGAIFPNGLSGNFPLITKATVTEGRLNLDQTLFSGTYFYGYVAVKAAERSAYFSKMTARGEVVQQVAGAYLTLIADQAEIDNAKALMQQDKVLFDQAHDKHAAGVYANLDELRARVQYQQQQQIVIAEENKRAKDEIYLKREIGIAPGQKIELTDPSPYAELAQLTPEDLRTEAYQNRQDYQNLQAQADEARLALSARKAERLPTLSFKGNYGVTDVATVGTHGTMSAVGTLNFPIFREASLRGDADVARAQILGVSQQLDDLRDRIDQQVRSALMDVQSTRHLVDVARSNVDLATKALSDETDRFNAGLDDTLPLTRAQATLQSAQSNLVETLYQYNLAKIALARSAGVLEQQYRMYIGR